MICDIIIRQCINIVTAAILQFVSNEMLQFRSALGLF